MDLPPQLIEHLVRYIDEGCELVDDNPNHTRTYVCKGCGGEGYVEVTDLVATDKEPSND